MLHEVQVQLNYKFLTRPVEFSGMQRIEKDEYPLAAIREMLLNALVHRTYMGSAIQIRVYNDKLSIWNEGTLPIGLNIENLLTEHNSRPRNPKIADACFKAGYIDAWGRGTLKIINSCLDAGLRLPEILEKDGGVQVTVFNASHGGQTGGQTGGHIDTLTPRQKEIYRLILENNAISRKEIAAQLRIAESAVQKHLKSLIDANKIKRIGTFKGYWKINFD